MYRGFVVVGGGGVTVCLELIILQTVSDLIDRPLDNNGEPMLLKLKVNTLFTKTDGPILLILNLVIVAHISSTYLLAS